ncbi:hypothetical protein PF008_g8043 [Phytophthora fragariae]|uniref:Uncharacterized protein n=1 Tax=Phytophthora fragariae TaxID=53985 RepID=A0A6G0S1A5_9STRA|nr:hypothetical protein PF008_g8043 [Phytophthora fragariae]
MCTRAEEATYCAGEDIPQSSCQASFIGSFAFGSLDDKYGRRLMFIFMLVFFLMGHRALRHQLGRDLHHVRASRCSALLTCSFLGWRTSAATQRAERGVLPSTTASAPYWNNGAATELEAAGTTRAKEAPAAAGTSSPPETTGSGIPNQLVRQKMRAEISFCECRGCGFGFVCCEQIARAGGRYPASGDTLLLELP